MRLFSTQTKPYQRDKSGNLQELQICAGPLKLHEVGVLAEAWRDSAGVSVRVVTRITHSRSDAIRADGRPKYVIKREKRGLEDKASYTDEEKGIDAGLLRGHRVKLQPRASTTAKFM